MFDLIIRNGTVVDGTGAPAFAADVAVKDGLIVEVAPGIDGDAAEVMDASGCLVTPGWVDIHTHYDGQVTWDDLLEPSSGHGVTTIVVGNCGVGFAPVRPGSEAWLVQLMEGVEDIPGTALHEGIRWSWESFPEYLDALEGRRWSMDVGAYVAHGPVRAYVMGERGARNEEATAEDRAEMARLVAESIRAGALGFSTSRTIGHKARDGEPVPGTFADEGELQAIAAAMAGAGGGVFEVAPQGITPMDPFDDEFARLYRVAEATGLTVSFLLLQHSGAPGRYREALAWAEKATAAGLRVKPQVAGRPFGMLVGWPSYHPFGRRPTYRALASRLAHDELVAELRKPEVKAAILAEDDAPHDPTIQFDLLPSLFQAVLDKVFVLGDDPDYEPTADMSVAAIAAARGVDPLSLCYDLMLERDGKNFLMFPFLNYVDGDDEAILEMFEHPDTVSGLADGGAHCRMICDASLPTYLLTHWTRDRRRGRRLPVEFVVKKQTKDTADLMGLGDRGVIEVGKRADLNVIDHANLRLSQPYFRDDLPAGGRRLLQDATGYRATIVAGEVTRRDGVDTGARPGRLIRGSR